MHKFLKPCSGDICEWFKNSGVQDQIIRYWVAGVNSDAYDECFFGSIRHIITMPDGSVILGISDYDDAHENNIYPQISYYSWNSLTIEWVASDQDDKDGETWQNHRETKLTS